MKLVLLPDASAKKLAVHYEDAFKNAVELYIVSAYLTGWLPTVELGDQCESVTFIVGRDFGITRKQACRDVASWLPARFKHRFFVALDISGFHPKALFWRDRKGSAHALVGSSNLTKAAASSNHEANLYAPLSSEAFADVQDWMKKIESASGQVSEEWLAAYVEAPLASVSGTKSSRPSRSTVPRLPSLLNAEKLVAQRQVQMAAYRAKQKGLEALIRRCEAGTISNRQFYAELPEYWGYRQGNRLQGSGWERKGRDADFQDLCGSLVDILDASAKERDDVVVSAIDRLARNGVPARRAFLSEMLCLRFPDLYPILNKPIQRFMDDQGYVPPYGASEGAAYLALAQWLRDAVRRQTDYPASDLAELDTIIWAAYQD